MQPTAAVPFEAELVVPPARGSFSTIGSFSIMLAVVGLLGLCLAGGLVMNSYNAAAPTAPAADASAIERFNYAMQVEWQGITSRYLPGLGAFLVWHVAAVVLLLVGGLRIMHPSESRRRFMLYVLLFVLLFELLRGGMYLLMMLEMVPLVDQILARELRQMGAQNAQMAPVLKRMAQGVTVVAIIVALVWPGVKILFYGWAARYLASREASELSTGTS